MDAINLRTARHALRAVRKGFRQTSVQGDPWQLGGSFVIDPKGNVLFAHTSREAGDHPDPEDILAALRRIKVGGFLEFFECPEGTLLFVLDLDHEVEVKHCGESKQITLGTASQTEY
jgi:hypothetical protein